LYQNCSIFVQRMAEFCAGLKNTDANGLQPMRNGSLSGNCALWGLLVFFCAAAGGADAPPAPEAVKKPAGENRAEWQKLETKHQPLTSIRQFLTPGVFDQTVQQIVIFPKDGGGVALDLPHFGKTADGKNRPALTARLNRDFIWVDLNGDGKTTSDETHRIGESGHSDAFTTTLHYEDGTSAPYCFCFKSIVDKEQYALLRMGSRVTALHDKRVILLDENGNGKFNDVGKDAVIVGDLPVTLLGKHIAIGDKLYEMLVHAAGTLVEVRPAAEMDTGTIDFFENHEPSQKAETLRIHTLIVTGADGSFAFDAAHKKLKAPAGAYDFTFGLFERAKEMVYMRKGDKTSFVVIPGKTTSPKWGGEITARFDVQSDGAEVTMSPPAFYGIGSEEYFPEHYRVNGVFAHIGQIWIDNMRIERNRTFSDKKFDLLPNGMLKPLTFASFRDANDLYEVSIDYNSGILGKVYARERLQFIFKSKTEPKK
jgi:hypothetical protein